MDFGKKYRLGNYFVTKLSRSLGKKELKQLRDGKGIPEAVQKLLSRGSLPYIKVEAISEVWAVEWCAGTEMYNLFDGSIGAHPPALPQGRGPEMMEGLALVVARMHMVCSIVGDREMNVGINKALNGYLDRIKADNVGNGADMPDEPTKTKE